jgi:hypothetical protein
MSVTVASFVIRRVKLSRYAYAYHGLVRFSDGSYRGCYASMRAGVIRMAVEELNA